jgi:hypothetical protein
LSREVGKDTAAISAARRRRLELEDFHFHRLAGVLRTRCRLAGTADAETLRVQRFKLTRMDGRSKTEHHNARRY